MGGHAGLALAGHLPLHQPHAALGRDVREDEKPPGSFGYFGLVAWILCVDIVTDIFRYCHLKIVAKYYQLDIVVWILSPGYCGLDI